MRAMDLGLKAHPTPLQKPTRDFVSNRPCTAPWSCDVSSSLSPCVSQLMIEFDVVLFVRICIVCFDAPALSGFFPCTFLGEFEYLDRKNVPDTMWPRALCLPIVQ